MASKTILTIDDSLADHILSAHALMAYDADVMLYKAMGGAEGLAVLRENSDIDTILLDVNMPEMDGFEFLEAYCEAFDAGTHDIYLMLGAAMTAEDQKKVDACECIKGTFTKPIDEKDMDLLYGV